MKGLIQSNQADELTPESIKQNIQIPDEFREAYMKVVAAGMTVMFSKESNKASVDAIMRGEGPLPQRLGQSIAGLLGMMIKESNNTIPPQVIIPAGVELLIEAADFLRRAGLAPMSNQEVGQAMEVMVATVLEAAGLSPQKIVGFVDQRAGGGAAPMTGA
jgi:hypothetical protein